MNERKEWIDSLKGIGIMLVVWGHLTIPLLGETIIYSFHMPLFFFISGYLFKNKDITIRSFMIGKIGTLLIPYSIYAAISFPFGIALNYLKEEPIDLLVHVKNYLFLNGSVGWNSPLWFLVVLFLVDISYFILKKVQINSFVVGTILFLLAFWFSMTGQRYPLGVNIVFLGLLFFYLGNETKKRKVIDYLNQKSINKLIVLLFLATINILFGSILNPRVSVYHNELGNFVYFSLGALAGIYFLFLIISSFQSFTFFNFYGKNTLLILATHYFFIYFYKLIGRVFLNGVLFRNDDYFISIVLTGITLMSYYPLVHITNRYFPFLSNKKIVN